MIESSLRAGCRGIYRLNATKPFQRSRAPHMGDVSACEPHAQSGRAQFLAAWSQWAGAQSGRDFSPAFAQAAHLIKNVDFSHVR